MENSRLPITKWVPALWFIINQKNGVSSHEVGRALGITQKSAWHLCHRIRLSYRSIQRKEAVFLVEVVLEAFSRSLGHKDDTAFVNARELALGIIESSEAEEIKPYQARFAGYMGSMRQLNLPALLNFVTEKLRVPILKGEKSIINELRNQLAHGSFGNPYDPDLKKAQLESDQLGYLCNLFNKLILCAAGYKGAYCDYSEEWVSNNLRDKINESFPML